MFFEKLNIDSQDSHMSLVNTEQLVELKKAINEYIDKRIDALTVANGAHISSSSKGDASSPILNDQQRIRFNVGGKVFSMKYANIIKENSLLANVCKLNPDQPIFIDRDPTAFDLVLKYFRGESLTMTEMKSEELLEEAIFYEISGLLTTLKPVSKGPTKDIPMLTEGCKLMTLFDEKIESQTLGLLALSKQVDKIQRYFGWGIIKLDVGGQLFETTKQTIKTIEDLMSLESDGTYFIDRNPEVFHLILRKLRGQTVFGPYTEIYGNYTRELRYYLGIETHGMSDFVAEECVNVTMTTPHSFKFSCGKGWNRMIKSEKLATDGITSHSFSLVVSGMSTFNLMCGFGQNSILKNVTDPYNIYAGSGAYLYANSGGGLGKWINPGAQFGRTPKQGDVIKVVWYILQKTIELFANDKFIGVLASDLPACDDCRFYVIAADVGQVDFV